MAIFSYVAKNTKGEIKSGDIEGKDARAIVENLRAEGFFVTSILKKIEKPKRGSGKAIFNRNVPLKEKMMFSRHLSVMLGSGLTLPRALNIISNQTKNKKFKAVIEEVEKEVKMGNTLADSLAKQTIFDELSVNMIRVGEVSGRLEEVLKILADQLEKEHNLLSKVRGAMYYPSVILVVMVGVGIAMMTYVVPSLTSIFQGFNTSLPLSTQIIVTVSNYMSEHQLVVFSIIAAVVLALIFFFRSSFAKKIVSNVSAKLPVIKNMIVKINNARFARIYSSLTQSGVSVVESLKIITKTLTNEKYRKAFSEISEEVQKGKKLHEELAKYPKLFPILTVQMVDVGEETGKTAEVLENLANFYESEVDQLTKNLSSVIEPVLMVIIGVAVGFFAISMILPMYSMMDQM